MSKEIKNYLHLYLGCQVEFGYEGRKKIGRLSGKVELYGWEVFDPSSVRPMYHTVRTELIKPILRPLSDMTEEEKIELIRIEHPEKTHPILSDIKLENGSIMFAANDGKMKHNIIFSCGLSAWEPNEFVYLLDKYFDLFGLIEAGLAIDKTTFQPWKNSGQ